MQCLFGFFVQKGSIMTKTQKFLLGASLLLCSCFNVKKGSTYYGNLLCAIKVENAPCVFTEEIWDEQAVSLTGRWRAVVCPVSQSVSQHTCILCRLSLPIFLSEFVLSVSRLQPCQSSGETAEPESNQGKLICITIKPERCIYNIYGVCGQL